MYLNDENVENKSHSERMNKNAVALDITYHNLQNKRSISVTHVDSGEINSAWLHLSNTMLKSDELKAIGAHYVATSKVLAKKSFNSLFRRGVFLVPKVMVTEISDYLEERITELIPLVDAFAAVYPAQVEAAKIELGDAFNVKNYPTVPALYSLFGIDYRWVSIGTPSHLSDISREIYLREQTRVKNQFEEAAAILLDGMRHDALKMVQTLSERLTNRVGEKKKVFKKATLDRLHEWAHNYVHGLSDVVYDDKLKPVAETIMRLTDVDPQDLRNDKLFREDVVKRMGEVEETLKKMIVERPGRAISFE